MINVKIAWILALVCLFALVPSCNAGVAVSGSFYAHDYVLTQGEDISSRDIYVYVFNKEDKRVCVDVEYESPEFIEVGLSTKSCFLDPDEYKKVYITLKAKEDAVPGNYTAKAYLLGEEVASADFDVAIYEYKRVELPIRGVYFEHFCVEPVKSGSGAIIYVPVLAEVNNPYKELSNVSIVLNVYTCASSEYTLYSGSRPLNRTETQFNYIPLMGWQSGKYEFTANVVSDGIVYAVSPVITVEDLTFGADYKRAQIFVFAENDTTVTNVRVYLKRAVIARLRMVPATG